MSWASIANNQTVSFNNLQDAVNTGNFVALTTIPASNEQITKTDASTYVNCDTSYAPFANKASNQLVVKSNLITTTTSTTTSTSTLPACTCFLLSNNEDSIDISIQFYDCQSGQVCNVCPAGGSIYLCIQDAFQATYTVHAGTGCTGYTPSFTMTSLGSSCTDSSSCL